MALNVKRILAVVLCLVALVSCTGRSEEVKTPTIKKSFAKKSGLNDSLVADLANFLETAILEGSPEDFMTKFDLNRFNQKATYTAYSDEKVKKFRAGFIESFSAGMRTFPEKIINTVNEGDFYDLLKYYHDPKTNNYRILFRLFSETDGLNYHDYELVRRGNQFLIQDIYIYLTGENLSSTINRLFLQSLPPNLFQKIINVNKSDDIKHLLNAVKSNEKLAFVEAKEHLDNIGGNLRHDKFYHVINTLVSSNLGDTKYMNAMEAMQKDFGDDPTWNLMAIDYYFMKSDMEETINSIDKLEEKTGDTFLNFQRGNIALGMEEYDVAANYFSKLLEEYPSYDTAKFNMITCYSLLGNFEKCTIIMDDILQSGVYTTFDLIEFVESVEEDGTNQLISLATSNTYLNWKVEKTN